MISDLSASPADAPRPAPALARRRIGAVLIAAFAVHGGFVALIALDEMRLSTRVTADDSVSVDLVDESETTDGGGGGTGKRARAAQGDGGRREDDSGAPASGEAVPSASGVESAGQAQKQEPPAGAAKAETPPAGTQPAQTPGGAQQAPAAQPQSANRPQTLSKAGGSGESPARGAVEPPPAPARGGAPDRPDAKPDPGGSAGEGSKTLPRLPSFLMPNFGIARAPAAGSAPSEDYKGVVYAMLEQVKQLPAAARARHASGAVVVTFEIDEAGQPRTIVLARSSGQGDLDAEALAMVTRAAPFPPPPSGVFRSFAPMIIFNAR